MKFSKKSRYGLTALIDLSVHSKSGHVALSSIADRNDISPQYLEQVFASLRRAGIVKSVKGPQGGYLLNDSPRNITIADILIALDGSYYLQEESVSLDSPACGIAHTIQSMVVDEVNKKLDEILKNLTLEDMEKEYQDYNSYDQMMYYI